LARRGTLCLAAPFRAALDGLDPVYGVGSLAWAGILSQRNPAGSLVVCSYFIGVVTISVILTPMFNAVRGSILIAALFHF
jgi:hypothetical protein